jgi:DNA-binding response OmpR family regulator
MKSILVIDDNTDIRENTAEILELAGYKVFTAENGKKGAEIAIGERPDVIICDIMMPELDGYGVLHLVRKNPETEYIPFIFLTAKTERSDFRKGMEMGADDYITKPFDEIELLTAVDARFKKNEILQRQYTSGASGIREFIKDAKQTGIFKHLAEKYDIQEYSKKQFVYQEGRRPRYLFYLIKGKIKAFRNQDIKEYITDLFSEGDLIGYPALIEDKSYNDSAEVLEDAEVLQIPKDDFLQMIFTDISIAGKFIRLITQNVKEKEDRLVGLAYSSLRKRVAGALLAIHSKFNGSQGGKLVEISREDIAQYVGTATESLIRTLGDFKAEKLIEVKEGKIIIPDPARLRNLPY